jgi:hypothetical protein
LTVIETYEYKGLWWLPGQEEDEDKRSGDLHVTRGRPELDLIGHFGHELISAAETEKAWSFELAERPRIVGLTTTGKHVTLEGHVVAYPTLSFPGIATGLYRQETALIGKAFGEDEAVLFDEIAVRATDLELWTRTTGLKGSSGGDNDPETGRPRLTRFDLHYEVPDTIEIPLSNGEHAQITFRAPSSGYGPESRTFTLTEEATFHLRFATPHTLAEVKERVGQIRDFFTLAVGRAVTILSVAGFQDGYADDDGRSYPIQLLWEIPNNSDPPTRPRRLDEMLFNLREAHPSLSDVLSKWFVLQDQFRPVFNLFFGVLYQASIFRDVQFLLWAHAVETYDFRRRDPNELPEVDHKRRMKSILDSVPNEWHDWLRMRLATSNYWTLDQRLRAVLAICPDVSTKLVGASGAELDASLAKFKNTRNYYTHYTPELEKKAARGGALYLLVVQLRSIIEMALLNDLGFPCDLIDKLFERTRRYDEIAHFKALVASDS